MPFFAGFAQGAGDALTTMRQEQQRVNEANANREQQALIHLTTSPNSDIAASAATALMHPSPPAGGFLGRMFGQVQGRPEYPTLRNLIQSTRGGQDSTGAATAEPAGAPPSAAPQGGAALPAGSPVEPGGPQMSAPVSPKVAGGTMGAAPPPAAASAPAAAAMPPPAAPAAAPKAAQGPPAMPGAPSSSNPLFFTAPQQAGLTQQADLEGKLLALGYAKHPDTGQLLDAQGKPLDPMLSAHLLGIPTFHTTDQDGTVHQFVGTQEVNKIPGAGRASMPQNKMEQDITSYLYQHQGATKEEATTAVRTAAAADLQAKQSADTSRATTAGVTATNAPAMADARLTALRQRVLNQQATLQGTKLSNELKTRVLNGQITGVEALRFAGQLFANKPGATTDDINEVMIALTAGNAKVGAGGPAATSPPGPTTSTTTTGPTVPATPSNTAAKLPPGMSTYKPNASEQSTLDTISAARPMMDRVRALMAGHETDNSWGASAHAVGQAIPGMIGRNPSDPIYQQLDPLIQHLKVFALGPYLHGIRNGAFVKQVSDNTPAITDTPARIITKLDNLKQNFADIEAAVGSTKPSASGTPAKGTLVGTAQMTAPDGRRLTVPAAEVERMKGLGATLVVQ
jgi:hypothetical protein